MYTSRLIFLITLLITTNQITSMETNISALELEILHYATTGNLTEVSKLLSKPEAQAEKIDGGTILCLAAKRGDLKAVNSLLSWGIRPNSLDNEGVSALHNATMKGYVTIMEILIDKGASLNHQITTRSTSDYIGATPLHLAVLFRKQEAAQFLIERNANLEIKTYKKSTPLDLAIDRSCTPILKALLDKGAHVHLKYDDGSTLLHRCVSKKDTMNLLLAYRNMNINAKDNQGNTPLHRAVLFCHEQMNKAVAEYHHNLYDDAIINDSALRLLLENAEIIINATNNARNTPLDLVRGKNKKLESLLLEYKAKTYVQLGDGEPSEGICAIQ